MKKNLVSIFLSSSVLFLSIPCIVTAATSADLPIGEPMDEYSNEYIDEYHNPEYKQLTQTKQAIQLPRKNTLRAQNTNQTTNTQKGGGKADCSKNVGIIFDDVNSAKTGNSTTAQKNFSWVNLGWLQTTFGSPNISNTISQTIIHWNNFNVLVRNGMIVGTKGKYPGKTFPNTNLLPLFMTNATREIGPPVNNYKENLTQFTWNCADSPSSVAVLSDDQGVVMGVAGTYCSRDQGGCKNFGTAINDSSLTKKLSAP